MISAADAARTTPRRRPRVWLALILLLVAIFANDGVHLWRQVLTAKVAQVRSPSIDSEFEDYVVFYAAGRLVLQGRGAELYDIDAVTAEEEKALGRPASTYAHDGILPYFNPPFLAALLAPLALLPLSAFIALLFVLVCVSVLAVGVLVERLLALEQPLHRAVFWSWYLSLGALGFLAVQSQLSLLPLLAWLGFFYLQRQGREPQSGAVLALALMKPQLIIVAVALLLWKRQWRTLAGFAAVAAVFAVASVLIAGPTVVIDYPRFLLQSAGWEHEKGVVLANMYGWSGFYASLLAASTLRTALGFVSMAATLVAIAYVCRGAWRPRAEVFPLQVGAVLAASLLISLHLYRQDLTLLVLLLALGGVYWRDQVGGWGWWPGLAGFVWGAQAFGPDLLFRLGVNIQTPALVLVFVALVIAPMVGPRRRVSADAPRARELLPAQQAA